MNRLNLADILLVVLPSWMLLARAARVAILGLVLLALSGCYGSATNAVEHAPHAGVTSAIDHNMMARQRMLLSAARWYDQLQVIKTLELSNDEAVDEAITLEARRRVDAEWSAAADAMRVLRAAVDAFSAALKRGERPATVLVMTALCSLRAALPERWRELVSAEGCR